MIAVDTSALAAAVFAEDEARLFLAMMHGHPCCIGMPTVLEAHLVIGSRAGDGGLAVLDSLLSLPGISTIPFDHKHLGLARSAFERYGKGRHAAGLNFGDCMAHAVARWADVLLLFKGRDFSMTDIRPALT